MDDGCRDPAVLSKSVMTASAIGSYMRYKWNGVGMPEGQDAPNHYAVTIVVEPHGG